jgi:hypothetical protein
MNGAKQIVPMHRQRLGEVVGHVVDSRDVPNDELLLGHAVALEANAVACRKTWRAWL